MRTQRNAHLRNFGLVVLLVALLLLAVGCGAQSSPKAVVKAFFDKANSHKCSSLETLILPPDLGDLRWHNPDADRVKRVVDSCESYSQSEVDTSHLDTRWGIGVGASPAEKANGYGDSFSVQAYFAVRQRDCSECVWGDSNCEFDLQQYRDKWWIVGGCSHDPGQPLKGTGGW